MASEPQTAAVQVGDVRVGERHGHPEAIECTWTVSHVNGDRVTLRPASRKGFSLLGAVERDLATVERWPIAPAKDGDEPRPPYRGERAPMVAALADALTERTTKILRQRSAIPVAATGRLMSAEIQAAEHTIAAQLLDGRRGRYFDIAAEHEAKNRARARVAAQAAATPRGKSAESEIAEQQEADAPERRCYIFERREPVLYTLYAQSEDEALAIFADKGGAAASDRNMLSVEEADANPHIAGLGASAFQLREVE